MDSLSCRGRLSPDLRRLLFRRERACPLPHRRYRQQRRVMDPRLLLGEPMGQSWLQLAELALAFVLSASIGLEREIRQKSAGLRTYTLVGFSSALVMLVSKYGFTNILESGPGRARSLAYRGADRVGHRLHRRRPHFCSKGYRSGSDDGGDCLADRRGRDGMRGRASDPGHRGDFWPFHRGLCVSFNRAPTAKIALGAVVAANFLSGRSRRPSRGARDLHPKRILGESRGSRAGSFPRNGLRARSRRRDLERGATRSATIGLRRQRASSRCAWKSVARSRSPDSPSG